MKERSHSPAQPTEIPEGNAPKPICPDKPKTPPMPKAPAYKFNADHMAAVFNLWNLRYSENPDQFSSSLDADGKPIDDYGEGCAIHFQKLSDKIYNS